MDLFGRKAKAEAAHLAAMLERYRETNELLRLDMLIKLGEIASTVRVTNAGVAQLINKLNPMFAKSEYDPDCKAESDKIEEAIRRLKAEREAYWSA